MLKLRDRENTISVDVDKPRTSIGRDEKNDIVLDDYSVSGFHAEAFFENGQLEIVDLGSSNGTFHNDSPISGRTRVKAWDTLRFGNKTLEVFDAGGRRPTTVFSSVKASASEAPSPVDEPSDLLGVLVFQAGEPGPARFEIKKSIYIGRVDGNDLVLGGATISSRHAQILTSDNQLEVVDLGSTNGTWVNDKQVQRQVLRHGDRVRFDETTYLVETPSSRSGTRINPSAAFQPGKTRLNPALSRKTATPTSAAMNLSDLEKTPGQNPGVVAVPSSGKAPGVKPATVAAPTVIDAAYRPAFEKNASQNGQTPYYASVPSSPKSGLSWLLFSLEGRLPRMPYFLTGLTFTVIHFFIYFLLAAFVLGVSNWYHYNYGILEAMILLILLAFYVFSAWCFIACTVKRLHDFDANGAWWLLSFIPFVNLVAQIMWLLMRGTNGPNRYGLPPDQII